MPDSMADVVFLLVIAAGFLALFGLLRGCDRIVRVAPVDTARPTPTPPGANDAGGRS